MEPNPFVQPTQWNANPLASTVDVIPYDGTNAYDDSTQPYDGFASPTSTITWKNPTAWHNTQLPGSEQIYYGGPTSVPLNALATQWYPNASPSNESGIYDPLNPINNPYVDLYGYDGEGIKSSSDYSSSTTDYSSASTNYSSTIASTYPYDSSTRNFDGTIKGESLLFFNNPTGWTAITGGPQ
jgi:hypothetical protein